ncbi:RING finger protein 34 [Podila epicladia]|nr:RING finger protein 34 [Podila epicladia]
MPRAVRDAARTSISFGKKGTVGTVVVWCAKAAVVSGPGCHSLVTLMRSAAALTAPTFYMVMWQLLNNDSFTDHEKDVNSNRPKIVYKMDYAGLSKLNIKTLRGYLLSYNVSTQGMIEKQGHLKPIPETSEVYFRDHLPETPEKSMSLIEEMVNFGRPSTISDSPTASGSGSGSGSGQRNASSSDSSDGWSWDLDNFFSRLFGGDNAPATQSNRPSRSQPQPQTQTQNRPSQPPPRQPYSNTARPSAGPVPGTAYRPTAQSQPRHGPPAGHPSFTNNQPWPSTYRPASSTQSSPRPAHSYSPSTQSNAPQTPRPGQHARPPTSTASSPGVRASQSSNGTTSGSQRTTTTTSTTTSSTTTTMTLEQVMVSKADPSTLSIKAIKAILDSSFVTYVGVVEKKDLVDRLQKLIDNTRAEQAMVQEQEVEAKKSPTSSSTATEDDNLCKICCDAALNCVMLNCNHMSTCMDW